VIAVHRVRHPAPANDTARRTVVRLLCGGGESHIRITDGIAGGRVRTVCGRVLIGSVVPSYDSEASCSDCNRIAKRTKGG
jgi:hypothetical protein